MPSDTAPRSAILFVTIDRPEDKINPAWHQPNVDGLQMAAMTTDRTLTVVRVKLEELAQMDANALNARWRPLAIFGAGSWSDWFQYGVDPAWKANIDNYAAIIRETQIPMLAVCGSHQLVSMAFNGWSAVAHMNDAGAPVPISEELTLSPPSALFPNPRVGEEGTYPVVSTEVAQGDRIVRAMGVAPMASVHHKDMVIATNGFTLLVMGDSARPAASRGADQAVQRCAVQALRRDDDGRLLYTSQFHPEIARFREGTADDGGAGQRFLAAFLGEARQWWASNSA